MGVGALALESRSKEPPLPPHRGLVPHPWLGRSHPRVMVTKEEQNAELLAYSMARWADTEFRSFADEDAVTIGVVELAAEQYEFLNTEHLRPIGQAGEPPEVETDDDDSVDETIHG